MFNTCICCSPLASHCRSVLETWRSLARATYRWWCVLSVGAASVPTVTFSPLFPSPSSLLRSCARCSRFWRRSSMLRPPTTSRKRRGCSRTSTTATLLSACILTCVTTSRRTLLCAWDLRWSKTCSPQSGSRSRGDCS